MSAPVRIMPPFADQTFDHFQQWVNRASSWLTSHAQYNNTEHGDIKGWRGAHFTTLCFDSFGRRCRNGADFQRAHDEGAFPVWWIWPDQIVEAITTARTLGAANTQALASGKAEVAASVDQPFREEPEPLSPRPLARSE